MTQVLFQNKIQNGYEGEYRECEERPANQQDGIFFYSMKWDIPILPEGYELINCAASKTGWVAKEL